MSSIARQIAGATTFNTINIRTVDIFLQMSPNKPSGDVRGIRSASFQVRDSTGAIIQAGTTPADGKIQVQISGAFSTLELLGGSAVAQYTIRIRNAAAEPVTGAAGQQRRLRMLGYQIGHSGPEGNGVDGVAVPIQTVDRAILEFQADTPAINQTGSADAISGVADANTKRTHDGGGRLVMAIQVSVQNRFQIIVPARIDRAVRGAPVLDAPDPDDRGWVNNRATGLNVDDARGALFGTTVGDVVRLKVVREDLDDAVPLFVTATGNQVSISQPAGGGPLPADGIFQVRSVSDTTTGSKVQVRLGSATGPIICEADAHTFTPKTLFITPHVCVIHSANAATVAAGGGAGQTPSVNGTALNDAGDAQMTNLFDTIIRPIWRPAGIEFQLGAVQTEVFTGSDGFTQDNVPLQTGNQMQTVFGRNRVAGTCNIYFVHTTPGFLGLGLKFEDRAVLGANNSGIMVGVNGFLAGGTFRSRPSTGDDLVHELGNDTAHELGHFLDLPHADHVNSPSQATDPPARRDSYNRRFLMHPNNLLPAAVNPPSGVPPRFNDIGYGQVNITDSSGNTVARGHRGCLLTLKDHPSHTSDGEVVTSRRRFRSPNLTL